MHDQLAVLMGGRIAEEIFVGDLSSGAQQDIERATQLARNMVCKWGMSEKLGPVTYNDAADNGGGYMISDSRENGYSEETARLIDLEVREILEAGNQLARKIILEYREQIELLTQMLIEFETLDSEDILEIVIKKDWDVERKRKRVQIAADLNKQDPADIPPPLPPKDGEIVGTLGNSVDVPS